MSFAPVTGRAKQKTGAWTKRKIRQERVRRERERTAGTPGSQRERTSRYGNEVLGADEVSQPVSQRTGSPSRSSSRQT